MVVSSRPYRNPRTGFYTDLAVDSTPIGTIVPNLKTETNSFDHSYINDNTEPHKHLEAGGNHYNNPGDQDNDPAYTHEGYLYCNGLEYYIADFPGLYEIIGKEYGGYPSQGIDVINPGTGYSTESTVVISAPSGSNPVQATASVGAVNGNTGAIIAINVNNVGSGYTSAPTVNVYGNGIGTFTHNGIANGSRTSGTYLGVSATGGSGTSATFDVVVDANGLPIVTLKNAGYNYAANNTLTITDALLGGGGAPNIIITVTAVTGGAGSSATFSVRLNANGQIQGINQANVYEWLGDNNMGTFKVPDMVTKKVVGNNSVYGSNSANAGGGQLGVGTVGGKWYLDQTLQDDYFSLGQIVTTGYDNVTETVSCDIIGQHSIKLTMDPEDLTGPPQHSHTVFHSQPVNDLTISTTSFDRYLVDYRARNGKVSRWSNIGDQKLDHTHGLLRRPTPAGGVATYDVWDWQAGAGDAGSLQNPITLSDVAPSKVNTTNNTIEIGNHGLSNGNAVKYTEGSTGIGGLTSGTTYYIRSITSDTFELYGSQSQATNPPATTGRLNLTSQGSGTHKFEYTTALSNLNYLASGSGSGSWQWQTNVPAPLFKKFNATSDIGGREKQTTPGQDIITWTTVLETGTPQTNSTFSWPVGTINKIKYTMTGGGGSGGAGSYNGNNGEDSVLALGNGSVFKITAGGGKKGMGATAGDNTPGTAGAGGTALNNGSTNATGGSNGIPGTQGTGSKLLETVQANNPNTGGNGGAGTIYWNQTQYGNGSSGVNVNVGGQSGDSGWFAPNASNGVFNLASYSNITGAQFRLRGGKGGTSTPDAGNGGSQTSSGGNGAEITITLSNLWITNNNVQTTSWIGIEGGGANGQAQGSAPLGGSSQRGGTGGNGRNGGGNGGGGGASTLLKAGGTVVAGAGGGGGGGAFGNTGGYTGEPGGPPAANAQGYSVIQYGSGGNGGVGECVGGGGGGGGAGCNSGTTYGGGTGNGGGGGGPGGSPGGDSGHQGGQRGNEGDSGWLASMFSGAYNDDHTDTNGSARMKVEWNNDYWTAGAGGGGGGAIWQGQVDWATAGSPSTGGTYTIGSGGSGGNDPEASNTSGKSAQGGNGYLKLEAGVVTGNSGGGTTITTDPIIQSGSIDDDQFDVSIVPDGNGVGNGAGSFKLPTTQVPVVVFTGGGSVTAHATATATLTAGKVTDVVLTSGGSGYTEAPVVHVLHGAGGGSTVTASINATTGTVTSLNLDTSNTYTYTHYLKFGNPTGGTGYGQGANSKTRFVNLMPTDTTNTNYFSIKAARGNTKNGGDDSAVAMTVYYQKSGQSNWNLMGTLVNPSAQRTDPIAGNIPAIDTSTNTGNYDGDSGATNWYTFTVDVPQDARGADTKFRIEQDLPTASGSNDTAEDKNHIGICELIWWSPKTTSQVFVPSPGAVSKPSIDSLTYTIEGAQGQNTTYSSGLVAGDATITLKSTTKIEPVASIDPDFEVPLLVPYTTCKYLIKAF